jgi:DNA replication and repair protein RecF
MLARAATLAQLQTLAAPIHRELTADSEALTLHYRPAYEPLGAFDEGAWLTGSLRDGLQAELERLRPNELRRGLTLTGPQRDDLSLRVNGLELRHYGSRGQNRTAMLAFKLAQVDWLHQRTGEQPVLLLDEVLAELDPARRGYLLNRLTDSNQALLTAADIGMFDEPFQARATRWTIEAGSLSG